MKISVGDLNINISKVLHMAGFETLNAVVGGSAIFDGRIIWERQKAFIEI